VATVRFETPPGHQAQVDFGQMRLWIGEQVDVAHIFVFTLGYSRRLWPVAYPHERLSALLDGHEQAFRHFGGVPLECLYDNPRTLVLGRRETRVLWHPVFEDFARTYGFTPRACRPYRAQTKGKVESGVKYVKRNALAGRRFHSWEAINPWLAEWAVSVADQRVHGTTHERPIDRFARETLTPLVTRPPTCSSRSSPGVRGSSRKSIRCGCTRSTEQSGNPTSRWRRRAASRTSRRDLLRGTSK